MSNNGSIFISATGSSGPYSYFWTPGSYTTEDITGLGTGNYSVTVTDNAGCSAISSATVIDSVSLTVAAGTIIPPGCNLSNGSISVSVSGGTSPYSYVWSTGGTTSSISSVPAGNYTVVISEANGCSSSLAITLKDSCNYVWPGDANHDGVANNLDILTIGIGYGKTGPVRPSASINWIGQTCSDWADTLPGKVNYKHIDCNGDGSINVADTSAVVQNYGFVHTNRLENTRTSANINLYTQISSDTAASGGSLITVQIGLGTSSAPVNNIYGLAYGINFNNPALVDLTSVTFISQNSWLGTPGTDLLSIGFPNRDAAITRTNHQNTSGYGFIEKIQFRTSGSLTGTGNASPLVIGITNPVLIAFDQTIIPVNTLHDSIVIQDKLIATSVKNNEAATSLINLYPNPTNGFIYISCPTNTTKIFITDVLGREIYPSTILPISQFTCIDLSSAPSGIYFLNVKTENGFVMKKIVKGS